MKKLFWMLILFPALLAAQPSPVSFFYKSGDTLKANYRIKANSVFLPNIQPANKYSTATKSKDTVYTGLDTNNAKPIGIAPVANRWATWVNTDSLGSSTRDVPWVSIRTADTSCSNTTPQYVAIGGMERNVVSGAYYSFKAYLVISSAATTTGIRLRIDGPSMTVFAARGAVQQAANGTDQEYTGTFKVISTDTLVNVSFIATGTNYYGTIEGVCVPSANGALVIKFCSEVASSAITIKQGSLFEIQRWQ